MIFLIYLDENGIILTFYLYQLPTNGGGFKNVVFSEIAKRYIRTHQEGSSYLPTV